jgi:large repetitive protein
LIVPKDSQENRQIDRNRQEPWMRLARLTRTAVVCAALVFSSVGFAAVEGALSSTSAGAQPTTATVTCETDFGGVPATDSQTLSSSSSGTLVLGGEVEGSMTGSCSISGTIPSTWSVDVTSGTSALSAGDGSGNEGGIEFDTDDITFTDPGTFTNAGTVADDSPGFTQSFAVADFVNAGEVSSNEASGSSDPPDLVLADGSSGSPTNVFDDQGTVDAGADSSIIVEEGTFILDTSGGVAASPGTFELGNASTLDVQGGSVTSGSIAEYEYLGTCLSAVEFGTGIATSSTGSISGSCSFSLSGTIPTNWTLDIEGGTVTAAAGSGNDGLLDISSGQPTFTGTGTFTNAGTFEDATSDGGTVQETVADFVNTGTFSVASTGGSEGPSLRIADAEGDVFENQGTLEAGTAATVEVEYGSFEQESGIVEAGPGVFELGDGSGFTVDGGSVIDGSVQTVEFLGTCASSIGFGSEVSANSTGTIDNICGVTLTGTIAAGWTFDTSASITATSGSGNSGTYIDTGNNTLTDSGVFTNGGVIESEDDLEVNASPFTNTPSGTVEVQPTDDLSFSSPPTNISTGTLSGGAWTAAGQLNLGSGASPISTLDATVDLIGSGDVTSGATNITSSLTSVDQGAELNLAGSANATLTQSLTNAGTLAVGESDTLSIDGSLSETSTATFEPTLDGTNPGTTVGQLAVTGATTLNGTLEVASAPGFVASPSDSYPILTDHSQTGTFATDEGLTAGGATLVVDYLPDGVTLAVPTVPTFTSPSTGSAVVHQPFSAQITTEGTPTPSLSVAKLPSWLTFTNNGNGTGTLSGTPTSTKEVKVKFTATSSLGQTHQTYVLTVGAPPAITSASAASAKVGKAFKFTVHSTGTPKPSLEVSGLPSWLTFTDNGNGTGTLSGTPADSGTADLTVTASNGVNPAAVQDFTVTVAGAKQ